MRKLSTSTDNELMELIGEGNARALEEIYRRYSGKLLRYFFRMLWKDENKAQDFLHDLFLKIIQNPGYYQPGRNFATWIFSVANNMCKNEYRRESVRSAHANSQGVVNLYVVEQADQDDDLSRRLDIALTNLDEDERNLYALRFEVEMSLDEMSAMLGCPTGTVKSRLFYLKKKLATALKTDEIEKFKYGIQ